MDLFKGISGRKIKNFPAAKIVHYKIGGPIDLLIYPKSFEEASTVLKLCKENSIAFFILGKGSNILVSDEGFRGVFIALDDCAMHMEFKGNKAYIGAAVILWDLIQKTIELGLGDMSNMSWIPGTVGGALHMNAGAFGTEIEEFVISVDAIDRYGMIKNYSKDECQFTYRKSALQDKLILGTHLVFNEKNSEEMKSNSELIISKRENRQPLEHPSCGSVFKRPPGNYAGALIEKSNLKGYAVGGARLSEKHANFILNENNAKASDIHAIIKHVQETVYKNFNIMLEREVKLIGFENVVV